ncbi:M50 family metallopeptidase [Candidatus Latescibacterota bacterium]
MFIRSIAIASLAVFSLGLPGPQRQFAGLTLASIFMLTLVPSWMKHHLRKMGTYHHEISHGLVSMLTSGQFHKFYVHLAGGGVSVTSGGKTKLVVSAGYIGTILFGAVYLAKSAQSHSMVTALYIIALLYAFSTIKAGDVHTASVGIAIGAIVGLVTHLAPGTIITRSLLNLIGLVLVYEGIRSLWTLYLVTATTTKTGSDAEAMSRISGGHPLHWAFLYSSVAALIIFALFGFVMNVK